MEDLKEIIYLSNDDFKKIIEEGSLTVGDIVIEYDPNSAYVVPFEVDDALSLESTNPVQNKVVTERIGNCVSIYAGGNITNGIQQANISAVYVYNNYNGGALRVFLAAKPTDTLAGRIVQRDSNGRVAATGANGVNDYVVTDSDLADSLEELDSKPANIQEWDETKEYKVGDIVRCKPGDFERFYTALVDNVGVQPTQWGDTTWTMKNSLMPYTATAFASNGSISSGCVPFANGANDNFYLKTAAQSKGNRTTSSPVIVMTEKGTGAILQDYDPTADNHLTNKQYVDKKTHIFTSSYILNVDSFLIQNINEFDDFHYAYNFQENHWMYGFEFSHESPARIQTGVTEIVCGGSSPSTAFLNISLTDLGDLGYAPTEIRITNASMIEFWFCEYDSGEYRLAIKTNGEVAEIWS